MILTEENYFSKESQMMYMGSSQFKGFMQCEAKELAKIKGEWEEPKTVALLIGSYVDAYFSGTLELFKLQNPEVFTRKGTLKADYQHAECIIERIERDKMFMRYMSGRKQVILTGEIDGVPVKIKVDCLHDDKIVDMKIMKDFDDIWVEGSGKVSFTQAWGYDLQGAMYQEIERQNRGESAIAKPFYIAGATKQKPEPNIDIFKMPQLWMDSQMQVIRANIQYYDGIKKGIYPPERCEKCDYCRATKVLKNVIKLEELI